jgi:hypothetical protein
MESAVSSGCILIINKATGLTGDDNYALLRLLVEQTLAQNVEKVQWRYS